MKHYIIFIYMMLIISHYSYARQQGYGYSEAQQNMIRANNNIKTFNQTGSSSVTEFSNFLTTTGTTVANTAAILKNLFDSDKDKKDTRNETCITQLDKLKKQFNAMYEYVNKELNTIIQQINSYNKIQNENINNDYYNLLNKMHKLQNTSNNIHQNIIKLNEMLIYMRNLISNGGDVTTFLANGQLYEKLYANNNNVNSNGFLINYPALYPNNQLINGNYQYPLATPIINPVSTVTTTTNIPGNAVVATMVPVSTLNTASVPLDTRQGILTYSNNNPVIIDNNINRPVYTVHNPDNIIMNNGWQRVGYINDLVHIL